VVRSPISSGKGRRSLPSQLRFRRYRLVGSVFRSVFTCLPALWRLLDRGQSSERSLRVNINTERTEVERMIPPVYELLNASAFEDKQLSPSIAHVRRQNLGAAMPE
jgi:hypothetical protein